MSIEFLNVGGELLTELLIQYHFLDEAVRVSLKADKQYPQKGSSFTLTCIVTGYGIPSNVKLYRKIGDKENLIKDSSSNTDFCTIQQKQYQLTCNYSIPSIGTF